MNKKIKKALYFHLLTLSLLCKNNDVYNVECATKRENVKESIYDNSRKPVESNLCAGITKEIYDYFEIISKEHDVPDYVSIKSIQESNWKARNDIDSVYIDSFPCDIDLQNHINKMAAKYEVPFEVLMILLDQESGGYWNCNGVISKTNDYGLPQINECMLQYIKENIGITKDQILYDPYSATEAEAFVVRYCFDHLGYDINNFDYRSVFGCYNGWLTWEKKEPCRKYADKCMERLEKHFGITDRYVHKK